MQEMELVRNFIVIVIVAISMLIVPACNYPADNTSVIIQTHPADNTSVPASRAMVYTMKGVAIDLPQSDFENMRKAGITILGTEWGMEESVEKTRAFLDQAQKAGLKVVMDGGFSYTAWGFTDDDWDSLPKGKHPVWQKEKVQTWVRALKDHPAVYAWDISNEFGENLPDGAGIAGSDWPKGRLTTEQLMQARADVLAVDPGRPIHVRTYGWDVDKMQPHIKSMLTSRVADIISLNLYSNYLAKGKLEWPDVIQDAGQYYVDNIKKLSPGTVVWLSVAAFEYQDLFQRPTLAGLNRDLKYVTLIKGLDGISFFCWGPVSQWDEKGDWYLPQTGADIWEVIKRYMKDPGQFVSNK
jgi:hypothetical protein